MRVLSISLDKKILKDGSENQTRQIEYGQLFSDYKILILSKQKVEKSVSENTRIISTGSRNKLFYIRDALKIGRKLAKPDVITAQEAFTGLIAWRLARHFGVPFNLQIHTEFYNPYFRRESVYNFLQYCLFLFLIKRADSIRVVSQKIYQHLVQYYQIADQRITVLPIYVDVEKLQHRPISIDLHKKYPRFSKIILMASRLTKEKNFPLAINVFKKILQRYPETLLLIVGEGPEKKNIESKVGSLRLEDHIIIEDWSDDLVSYYKTTDIFLLTSNYEGYGRTLVEAAAVGYKIISSDVGISREIGIPDSNIFQPGDGAGLEGILSKALNGDLAQVPAPEAITKQEYLARYLKTFQRSMTVTRRGVRVLMITQKMDYQDDVLGVYHSWAQSLASKLDRLNIICLYRGAVDLPKNTYVYSLGKENGQSNWKYLWNFYKYLFHIRNDYDVVFVHMNWLYIYLGWPVWKLSGKKIVYWNASYKISPWMKFGLWLSDKGLTSVREAFEIKSDKIEVVGQGIDIELFKKDNNAFKEPLSLLFLGRISPVKNLETLISAVEILANRHLAVKLDVIGWPEENDREYFARVRKQAEQLEKAGIVKFSGRIANHKTPEIYNNHFLFINLTASKSFDKSILEAMSCETLVLVSNTVYKNIFEHETADKLIFKENQTEDLADKIEALVHLPSEEAANIGFKLRQIVVRDHGLDRLTDKLVNIFKSCV